MSNSQQPSFSWLNPKCEIRETGKIGKGVFAKSVIHEGEIVCVAGGYVLTIEDEKWFGGEMADKPIEIEEDFYLGPRTDADIPLMPQVYINHSCNPNTGIKGQILYMAMKTIFPNEEVCIDYAMTLWVNRRSKLVYEFPCRCGHPDCRRVVAEDDWKIPDLQHRYDGWFSWYLQEKINKQKRT